MTRSFICILFLISPGLASAFITARGGAIMKRQLMMSSTPNKVEELDLSWCDIDGGCVDVYASADGVGSAVCRCFLDKAKSSIKDRGAFYVAIPGGSVLNMLGGLKEIVSNSDEAIEWDKVNIYYVNHKAVANDDPKSTHFKAQKLFLNDVGIPAANVRILGGSADAVAEANAYSALLKDVPTANGMPQFDLMLLGMGKDGHIGSLYPNRPEVAVTDTAKTVLSVAKEDPPASITLSLPVMNNAKSVKIVCAGEDKAEAVLNAIERSQPAGSFPVVGIKKATWVIDQGAASSVCTDNECRVVYDEDPADSGAWSTAASNIYI